MRIIAGSLKGRIFESPRGHRTHPMSEKIRGAIFNALGDIKGLTVFDPYAGSGALSLEAISRGAAAAQAIEMDKAAYKTIKMNAESLGIDNKLKVTHAYAASWSKRFKASLYDLVFLDPPYDLALAAEAEMLALHTKPGGIVIFSLPPHARIVLDNKQFKLIAAKAYGDATTYFYRRLS